MLKTRNIVFTGLCIAMGLALPQAFHMIPNAGSIFLPMHIPVLLCGLICGYPCGIAAGLLTPFLSSIFTGMPPSAILPAMMVELAVYGLVGGVLLKVVHTPRRVADVYIALIGSMLAGRIAAGVVKALIFNVGAYSMQAWIASSFVTAIPGIVIQLIVIPTVVVILEKAKIIAPVGV